VESEERANVFDRDRRKATNQAVTCWFLLTVAVIKVCCYRTAKLHLLTVELDYRAMKWNVVLL
jgi:hypothetical protein